VVYATSTGLGDENGKPGNRVLAEMVEKLSVGCYRAVHTTRWELTSPTSHR